MENGGLCVPLTFKMCHSVMEFIEPFRVQPTILRQSAQYCVTLALPLPCCSFLLPFLALWEWTSYKIMHTNFCLRILGSGKQSKVIPCAPWRRQALSPVFLFSITYIILILMNSSVPETLKEFTCVRTLFGNMNLYFSSCLALFQTFLQKVDKDVLIKERGKFMQRC